MQYTILDDQYTQNLYYNENGYLYKSDFNMLEPHAEVVFENYILNYYAVLNTERKYIEVLAEIIAENDKSELQIIVVQFHYIPEIRRNRDVVLTTYELS